MENGSRRAPARIRLGAHVETKDPLGGAAVRGADVVQINLSSPRMWVAPKPRRDAAELTTQSAAVDGVQVFTHAPYLINVASGDPALVTKSRACLRQQVAAAASIGAAGVIVHAGHAPAGAAENRAAAWVAALQDWVPEVPVLIENTAGGEHAVARTFADIAALFAALDGLDPAIRARVGFCLDTCHAHAGGLELPGLVDRLLGVMPELGLVHANDSKDLFASRRDRHEHFGAGQIGVEAVAEVIAAAGAPAVVETAGGPAEQAADIAALRRALGI